MDSNFTKSPEAPAAQPCSCCVRAAKEGKMRHEAIQPLPPVAPPRALDLTPCCHDCALAGTLVRLRYVPDWDMARTVVANDRQDQLRLPGTPMGLVALGLMRPNAEGDMNRHHAWLEAVGIAY